jgi:hypothetical protein
LSGTAIGDIERAEAFLTVESLFLISWALGVSASELLAELDSSVGGPSEFMVFPDDESS